jgi:TolA-binding protein
MAPSPRERLDRAEGLLVAADLEAAAAELLALVEAHPASPEAPRAQFQLAAIHLAPSSPLYDLPRGVALLEELLGAYPASPWRLASEAVLKLTGTNADLRRLAAELQAQIDKLKRIDIGSEG